MAIRRRAALPILLAACGGTNEGDESTGSATTDIASSTGVATTSNSSDASTSGAASESSSSSSTGEPVLPFSGELTVMTFNVLCSLCGGSDFDPWDERVPWMGDTIVRHDPDLVGLQEIIYADEVDQILAAAPGYAAAYYDEGELPYPDATVLYREALFELVDHGFYWLSPTPDQPRSTGFADGFQLARLVAWTVLRRRDDGAELFFATTHFDNNSPSQELSAPLVLERTAPFATMYPVVLVGDFNSDPASEAYALLTGGDPFALENAFDLAPDWTMDTNQDSAPEYDVSQRIDHIFVAGGPWTASQWIVDTWTYGPDARYVSDHFAITADLDLAP